MAEEFQQVRSRPENFHSDPEITGNEPKSIEQSLNMESNPENSDRKTQLHRESTELSGKNSNININSF